MEELSCSERARRHMSLFFFFTATATSEIYTLSLHDALPIFLRRGSCGAGDDRARVPHPAPRGGRLSCDEADDRLHRSEEHTSELQSRENLVCRLLLEKKKNKKKQKNQDKKRTEYKPKTPSLT